MKFLNYHVPVDPLRTLVYFFFVLAPRLVKVEPPTYLKKKMLKNPTKSQEKEDDIFFLLPNNNPFVMQYVGTTHT